MKIDEVGVTAFDAMLKSEPLLLADFWAPWCGPCRMVGPVLEQLAEDYPDCRFVKVNVDTEPALAERYGIQAIPSVLLFRSGELADRVVGAMPRSGYAQMIDNNRKG